MNDRALQTPQPSSQQPSPQQPSQPAASYSAPTPEPSEPPTPGDPSSRRSGNPARRQRTRFWAGFAIGFLLLSVLSCGGVFMATGLSRLNLRDLQNTGQAWVPPPVTATPEAAETPVIQEPQDDDTGTTVGRFQPGEQLRNATSSMVNIRATPGYLSKPADDEIAQVPPGGTVEIVGDWAMADNLTWWLIRYRAANGTVVEGWMAEATASGVQILAQ